MCARRYLGAIVYDDLESAREREQRKHADEDFLLANVADLSGWLTAFDAFAPVCAETAKLHAKLHADAPLIMQRIARAFRAFGGYATIQRRRAADGPAGFRSSSGEESEHEEVRLARLAGEPMTNPNFHPNAGHARLRRRLVALLGGREGKLNDMAVSELLDELSATEETMTTSVKEIRAWSRDAEKFVEGLMEAQRLFTRDNLAILKAWGAYQENDEPFVVDTMRGSVTFRGFDDDHATVAMPSARIPMVLSFAMIKEG